MTDLVKPDPHQPSGSDAAALPDSHGNEVTPRSTDSFAATSHSPDPNLVGDQVACNPPAVPARGEPEWEQPTNRPNVARPPIEHDSAAHDAAAQPTPVSTPATKGHPDGTAPLAATVQIQSKPSGPTPPSTHDFVPTGDARTTGRPTFRGANSATYVPQPGARMFGDYELLNEIARGGMGVVYKARQVSLNRLVALKMILSGQLASDMDVERFYAEAESAANLHHPNIVAIHEVAERDGQHFFSMDFIDGPSLGGLIRAQPLDPLVAAYYLRQIADGIEHAHQHGILHRDLKPANVLMRKIEATDQKSEILSGMAGLVGSPRKPNVSHLPVVTDFGLAKKMEGASGLTAIGVIVGTPSYMPPEQASARNAEIGPWSDVYSLGAILYEMLCARPPFEGATPLDTLVQVQRFEPTSPRLMNRKVDRDLETICLKCLRKEPRRRYASARELIADLDLYLARRPILSRPVGKVERGWLWCRRNPVVAALVALAAILLATGTVVSTLFAISANVERQRADKKARAEGVANRRAQASAVESRTRLVRQLVANGMRRMDEADLAGALPWLAEALVLERGDSLLEEPHRFRLASALEQCIRPTRIWFHAAEVRVATFSPDGSLVLTACDDHSARLWDSAMGKPIGEPLMHDGPVLWADFSPDGARIVTTSADGTARIWDARTCAPSFEPLRHGGAVSHAEFTIDGTRLATASDDQTARIWNAISGEPLSEPLVHQHGVHRVAFSRDGRRLATASGTPSKGDFGAGDARIFDVATGALIGAPLRHDGNVRSVVFSDDGTRLFSAADDFVARIWNTSTQQLAAPALRHRNQVSQVAISPDDRVIATAGDDDVVRLWDAHTGEVLAPPLHLGGKVRCLAFSPDARRVAAGAVVGVARVFDLRTGEPIVGPLWHNGPINHVEFAPDGHRLMIASRDGSARLFDFAAGEPAPLLLPHKSRVNEAWFSPNGRQVLTACSDGAAHVWNSRTGKPVYGPLAHQGPVPYAEFSRDGTMILTCSEDGTARVWNARTGKPLGAPLQHAAGVRNGCFSPDGRLVATASLDNTARIWDTVSGKPRSEPLPHDADLTASAFSPNGRLLATADSRGAVKLWNIPQGTPAIDRPMRHTCYVRSVVFSPDSRRLLSAAGMQVEQGGGEAVLWDVSSGKRALPQFRHADGLGYATFDRQGKRIVTASFDDTLRVWSASTGQPLTPPMHHKQDLFRASFSPNGRQIVSASDDYSARIWEASTGDAISAPLRGDLFCRRASFSPNGRRLLTAPYLRAPRIWELPFATQPVEDLVRMAELFSCHRLVGGSGLVQLELDEFRNRWELVRDQDPSRFEASDKQIAAWHRREESESWLAAHWFAASLHASKLVELDPNDHARRLRRALSNAELERWGAVAADLDWLMADGDADPRLKYQHAMVALAGGDLDGYRRSCQALLHEAAPEALAGDKPVPIDPTLGNMAVRCAVIGISPGLDSSRLVSLADQVLAAAPNDPAFLNTLGAACFRAGRLDDARRYLEAAVPGSVAEDLTIAWLFLALTEQALGHPDQAQQWYATAQNWTANELSPKSQGNPATRIPWESRLQIRLIALEAKQVLMPPLEQTGQPK